MAWFARRGARIEHDCKRGAQAKADGELVVAVEKVGRHQAHEKAAHRAAGRDHQIEAGEIAGVRLEAGQFAMAHHAEDE